MKTTHAGGVLFKIKNNKILFMLITAKNNTACWVLPKGHRLPYELLKVTALREITEETGCQGKILKDLGFSSYQLNNKMIKIKYFLVQLEKERAFRSEKFRKKVWLPYEKAFNKLCFNNQKLFLEKAFKELTKNIYKKKIQI